MEQLTLNGMRVLHHQNQSPIATVRFVVGMGAMHEASPTEYGAAHFIEHMGFKGTERTPLKELNMRLSAVGEPNAYTSHSRTVFHLTCATAQFGEALELLAEMMFEPLLEEEEFEKERKVILEEWQTKEDTPMGYFWSTAIWHVAGYDMHPVLGTKKSLDAMTLERLVDVRKRWYTPENMTLVVVGDVDHDELAQAVDEVLHGTHGIEAGDPVVPVWPEVVRDTAPVRLTHDATQACIGLFMDAPSNREGHEMNYANEVFGNLFGGGMHSLLFNRLREDMGLCYSTGATEWGVGPGNLFVAYAMLGADNVAKAHDEMQNLLAECCKGDVITQELLATAKTNFLFGLARRAQTSGGYAYMMGDCLATMGVRSYEDTVARVGKLAVGDVVDYANWMVERGSTLVTLNAPQEA